MPSASKSRLYVGNLPYQADENGIKEFFKGFNVLSVKIILDRETSRPKGFAFVDIAEGSEVAILALNGQQLGGRTIKVSVAIDKPRGAPAHTVSSPKQGGGLFAGVVENAQKKHSRRDEDDDVSRENANFWKR